jgi:tetratricopeptide (TPR) repeat protein
MSERVCPSELDLDRAYSVGDDPEITGHVESCDACRAWWADTTAAIELARELRSEVPSAHDREELRTSLLATNPRRPEARRRAWMMPAFALAAAAAVLAVATRPRTPTAPAAATVELHPRRGAVHGHVGAQYALAANPPDEIVRLRDGTIDVDVDPLHAGERFRVIVGADEIEVRGTSFEVIAGSDHLVSVRVVHGRVEVRHVGSPPEILTAGQVWHAESLAVTPTTPALPPPAPAPAPIVPPAPPVRRTTPKREPPSIAQAPQPPPATAARPPTDPQEVAFVAGWDAMRRSDFRLAAAAFARVVALDPSGSLAEDGAFWHAVALARVPRLPEAIAALREFLEDYATSARAGEASAMLGWMLADQGESAEARRRFEAAVHDPSASVQASARKGLAALDRTSP